jgi:nitrogen fixation NifU-like protein
MLSIILLSFLALTVFAVGSAIYMYLHERKMQLFNGKARATGACDGTMQIFLRIENDKVIDVRSSSDGCGISKAAAQTAADLALYKSVEDVAAIDCAKIQAMMGQLPKDHEHAAMLAAVTLQSALENYLKSR